MTKTREEWLRAYAKAARAEFKRQGLELPTDLRIGCAWISRKNVLGVSWPQEASSMGASEVTVSLKQDDTVTVAGALTHELVHASGISGHGKDFATAGAKIGLSGNPKSMVFTTEAGVPDWAMKIIAKLGDYPTGTLQPEGQQEGKNSVNQSRVPRMRLGVPHNSQVHRRAHVAVPRHRVRVRRTDVWVKYLAK